MAEHGVGMRQFGEIFDYDGQTYRIHPDGQFAWASDLNALHAQVQGLKGDVRVLRGAIKDALICAEMAEEVHPDWIEFVLSALRKALSDMEASGCPDCEALRAQVRELRECLEAIRDYAPSEVVFDEYAYRRMVASYQDAAKAGLGDCDKREEHGCEKVEVRKKPLPEEDKP